jgi:hypothetical protein
LSDILLPKALGALSLENRDMESGGAVACSTFKVGYQ